MVNKLFAYCAILLLLFSCKTRVPEDVIDKATMEDLLYDYHLAQSLAKNKRDSVNVYSLMYTEAVYRKYGITAADFNRSMEWYTRNSEELFKIYQNIDKRFAKVNSVSAIEGNPYASMTAEGDTMNIWSGKDFYLMSNVDRNFIQFEQIADSSFSKDDRLMWQFDSHWYYREGTKNAMVALSLVYENDSVVSNTQMIYSEGSHDVYIRVGDLPVKSIQGFVYQMSNWKESPELLIISDPVLVRFKKQKPKLNSDRSGSGSKDMKPLSEDSLRAIRESLQDDRVVNNEKPLESAPQRILHLPR